MGASTPLGGTRGLARSLGLMIVLALLGAAPASAAIDPDLPAKPKDLADLFTVDEDGSAFCPEPPAQPRVPKKCPPAHSSADLIQRVAESYPAGPRMLRVAKARKNCAAGTPATPPGSNPAKGEKVCWTGVPKTQPDCSAGAYATPYCQLAVMKLQGRSLGVIVGAAEDGEDDPRSVADIAWQACQINAIDPQFYDFLFLDLADALKGKIDEAVALITRGEKAPGVKCEPGRPDHPANAGWDVISNDNGWDDPQGAHPLSTLAYAHATHIDLLTGQDTWRERAEAAARPNNPAPAVTDRDRRFIQRVDAANPNRVTHAILRPEVSNGTGRLASLLPWQQRNLLTRWARPQTELVPQFTFLYPLYVHGNGNHGVHYDSVEEETYAHQMDLIAAYQN